MLVCVAVMLLLYKEHRAEEYSSRSRSALLVDRCPVRSTTGRRCAAAPGSTTAAVLTAVTRIYYWCIYKSS